MNELPFTHKEFLDVFAAYNDAMWPFALLLWLTTAWGVLRLFRGSAGAQRVVWMLLIVHWIWSAVAYHVMFFSRINPAAWTFAGLFVVEAALLAWHGIIRNSLEFSRGHSRSHILSAALIVYALAYPTIIWVEGYVFPEAPTFGIPCPTTILTIGLLLGVRKPLPFLPSIIPIFWAFIGGSAAFLLKVHADYVLLAAGVWLLSSLIAHSRLGRSVRAASGRALCSCAR